jgi:hypothetical protein
LEAAAFNWLPRFEVGEIAFLNRGCGETERDSVESTALLGEEAFMESTVEAEVVICAFRLLLVLGTEAARWLVTMASLPLRLTEGEVVRLLPAAIWRSADPLSAVLVKASGLVREVSGEAWFSSSLSDAKSTGSLPYGSLLRR